MSYSKGNRWTPYQVIQENLFHPLEARPKSFFKRTIIVDDYLDNRTWFTPGVAIGKGGGATLADAFPQQQEDRGSLGSWTPISGQATPVQETPKEQLGNLEEALNEYEETRGYGLKRLFHSPDYEGDEFDTVPVTPVTSSYSTPYSSPKGKRKERASFPSTPAEEYTIPVTPFVPPTYSPEDPRSVTPSGPPTPYKNSELAHQLAGGIQLRNEADLDHWASELERQSHSYSFGARLATDRLTALGEDKKAHRLRDAEKAFTYQLNRLRNRKGSFEKKVDIYRGAKFSLLRLEKQLQSVGRKVEKKGIGKQGKVKGEK